jgi:ATP-binding cassette subfamily B protein
VSTKSVPQMNIRRGPGINFEKSNEKLNNPKETTLRILNYIGNKKASLVLIFVFCVITTLVSIMGTKLNGEIVDKYISVGDISGLFRICIVLICMYLVATLSTFIQNRLMVSISQKTSSEIRKDLYDKMQHLPLKYFDTHSSGDLMSRLTNDIDNINMTLSQSITQLISGIINIVGMLVAMLMLNKTLAIIGLITTPITILATRTLIKYTQPLFIKKQAQILAHYI